MKKNLLFLAASVLLSLALWFFVVTRGQSGISLEVPVHFTDIPSHIHVSGETPTTVIVNLRGHERFLEAIHSDDIKVELSLSNISRGTHQIGMDKARVVMPPMLRLVSINPPTITVRAEEKGTRMAPVRAVTSGMPARGYRVRLVEVQPKEVSVEGVRGELKSLKYLYTEPVDITDATDSVVTEARVTSTDSSFVLAPQSVTVKVVIIRERQ